MNQQEGGLSINGMGSAPVGRKKKKQYPTKGITTGKVRKPKTRGLAVADAVAVAVRLDR